MHTRELNVHAEVGGTVEQGNKKVSKCYFVYECLWKTAKKGKVKTNSQPSILNRERMNDRETQRKRM